jgi:hypothetical protein
LSTFGLPPRPSKWPPQLLLPIFFLDNRPGAVFYCPIFREKARADENGTDEEQQLRILVLLLLCTGLPDA